MKIIMAWKIVSRETLLPVAEFEDEVPLAMWNNISPQGEIGFFITSRGYKRDEYFMSNAIVALVE